MPPAKRPNYDKLHSHSPFKCPWKELINMWYYKPSDSFCVLRDRSFLKQIDNLLKPTSKKISFVGNKEIRNRLSSSLKEIAEKNESSLVPVQIDAMNRGCCESLSMICLPTKEDLRSMHQESNYFGPMELNSSSSSNVAALNSQQSSRKIIGYIGLNGGGYCFTTGKGSGIGFICIHSLSTLISVGKQTLIPTVLIRDPKSLQYRLGKLSCLL